MGNYEQKIVSGKGRILAIDYGARHVGVAVSDPDRLMAFGRGKILNKNFEQLVGELAKMIISEAVTKVLVGLPLGEDGEETSQTVKIREFSGRFEDYLLAAGVSVEFEFVDESFSSYEAGEMLKEMGIPGSKQKSMEDELAAVILVRRYIEKKFKNSDLSGSIELLAH